MAKKPQMQVHVQSSSFKELLEVQKGAAESLTTMKTLMDKMNQLNTTQLKQKTRLKDLQETEIKHLQRKNELSASEAKAIAHLVGQMKTFPSLFERLQDKTKGLTNFIKNPMAGIRTGLLKATNIGGINEKRLEREKFITAQKALGVNKSFSEHAEDFQKSQDAAKAIKKNEQKIAKLKQETGMNEKQLANTEAGKGLFATRKNLTDEYAKHDARAAGIKGNPTSTPSQQFAESSKNDEQQNEDARLMNEQTSLLQKIEANTRGASPDQKAQPKEEKGGGGLLGNLLGGGGIGKALKGLKDFGVGIVLVAGALWVASKAFKSFAEVEWADIGKGLVVLGGFVAMSFALGKATGDMKKAAIGLALLSGSLWLAGKAINSFAEIDWETVGKAGVSIAGLGIAGALLGKNASNMLLGAVGLAAMGGGLWVVAKALQNMQEVGWETMGKAAVAITGLGLASLLLGPAAPMMIAAGAGLGIMGAGLWVVGEALQAVGEGFESMVSGIERIGQLNGDNLWNVAKGLGAVAAAMVAFGGAQALAGIGNLVGRLLSFGSDSPMEQLEKISKYGFGISKAGKGMQDLGAGMKAFSEIKGDSLKDTMKSLKEFPWEQATKFVAAGGSMSTDGGKVYNASKGNADKKAEVESSKSAGGNTVVAAPVTNVKTTNVQTQRPAIRNSDRSRLSTPQLMFMGGARYSNDF